MNRLFIRLAAVFTALCLLLSGCSLSELLSSFYGIPTAFEDMQYSRPDVSALTLSAQECTDLAQNQTDVETLWTKIGEFFGLYSDFYTQYLLCYIHYCMDITDIYWEEEYTYCEERTSQAEAARDRLMYALADCPLREKLEAEDYFGAGFFDDYDGDSIWTEEFQALMEQESELLSQYYEITSQTAELIPFSEEYYDQCGEPLERLYVQLVALRQQLALEAGYDSYPEFAYEYYFSRDYTAFDAAVYCDEIAQELVPLYRQLASSGFWSRGISESSEYETYSYVRKLARNMGGIVEEAFTLMAQGELYDIAYRDTKFNSSFEAYLYDYEQPFVFIAPDLTVNDQLTFAHEFGHFCNDYASYGTMAGIDGAEVFSQGMEYLSLIYTDASDELRQLKLADSLCVYVEQAAYNSFEQQVYGLTGEDLTEENVRLLFQQTGEAFGFDSWDFDSRSYVGVTHFFVQPMYVISYVVSNDAAFQLYQLELQSSGEGLKIYTESLDTEQGQFLAFLEEAGLESPFAEGRLQAVKETFREIL